MKSIARWHYPFHLFAYYVAWFAGLKCAAHHHGGYAVLIILLCVMAQAIWQHRVQNRTQGLCFFILLFTVIGTLTDTLFLRSGIIEFASSPFGKQLSPPWMMMLWVSFAMLFYSTLSPLLVRYGLSGLLGLFGFALAYSGGVELGAAAFPHGYVFSAICIGLVWGICLPLCCYIFNWKMRYGP